MRIKDGDVSGRSDRQGTRRDDSCDWDTPGVQWLVSVTVSKWHILRLLPRYKCNEQQYRLFQEDRIVKQAQRVSKYVG